MNGNMTSNSALGTLTYPAATALRPHTPLTIGGQAIGYDANGNMTSDGERTFLAARGGPPVSNAMGGT